MRIAIDLVRTAASGSNRARPRRRRRRPDPGRGAGRIAAGVATVAAAGALVAAVPQRAVAVTSDGQVWVQGIVRVKLTERLRLWLEAQPRIGGDGLRQLLLRPAVGWQVTPNWSIWQGYGFTPGFDPYRRENRLYQESLYDHSFGSLRMVNRTRLEERFIEGVEGVSLRARHLLRFTHPVDAAKRWFVAVSDEAFATLNDASGGPQSGFDQNRAYVGLRWQATQALALEIGYLHQFVDRTSDDDLSNNNAYLGFDLSI